MNESLKAFTYFFNAVKAKGLSTIYNSPEEMVSSINSINPSFIQFFGGAIKTSKISDAALRNVMESLAYNYGGRFPTLSDGRLDSQAFFTELQKQVNNPISIGVSSIIDSAKDIGKGFMIAGGALTLVYVSLGLLAFMVTIQGLKNAKQQ